MRGRIFVNILGKKCETPLKFQRSDFMTKILFLKR